MTLDLRRIAVFCGSSTGSDPSHAAAAREVGALLAAEGIGLVYGGGAVGLMGVLADATLEAGGEVTGVIPRDLWDKEVGHAGLTELLVVDSMHERKLAMADRADAFIALPGGVGTFEEVFEAITWTQLGIHTKPVGFLDVAGFYQPLLSFLDDTVDAGFVRSGHREMIVSATSPGEMLLRLRSWTAIDIPKWLDRDQR